MRFSIAGCGTIFVWRFAFGRFAFGGLLRLAVCVWRFLAVCVWRIGAFGGFCGCFAFAGDLRAVCGRFAGVLLRLAVCGGLQAVCGRFAFGGLRLAACGGAGVLPAFWLFCRRFAFCWRFASGLRASGLSVCGRPALWRVCGGFGGLAVGGCFAAGGLRAVCGRVGCV